MNDDIVKLEELRESNNISDLVNIIDFVLYYKDSAGITVNTIFKHGI